MVGARCSWKRTFAAATVAAAAWAGGCGRVFEGGVVVPDGGQSRLTVLGAAEVTISNQGSAPLSVTIGWGAAGQTEDDVPAGVAQWWSTDRPRWFLVSNRTGRPAAVTFRVKGADAALEQPAK